MIVPLKLQERVLQELHAGHQGIVKMNGLARSHMWWPGMDHQIEGIVRNCDACQETRPVTKGKEKMRASLIHQVRNVNEKIEIIFNLFRLLVTFCSLLMKRLVCIFRASIFCVVGFIKDFKKGPRSYTGSKYSLNLGMCIGYSLGGSIVCTWGETEVH